METTASARSSISFPAPESWGAKCKAMKAPSEMPDVGDEDSFTHIFLGVFTIGRKLSMKLFGLHFDRDGAGTSQLVVLMPQWCIACHTVVAKSCS